MEIVVRHPLPADLPEWTRMRIALWPEHSAEIPAEEIAAFLSEDLTGWLAGLHAVFVAARSAGGLCGFLEASVRPLADGCTTHPVGYIEGWYVDPDVRRRGVGKALAGAAEGWAASQGCREMASDTQWDNSASIAAHRALGFEVEGPTVRFRKWLATTDREMNLGGKIGRRPTLVLLEGTYAICRLAVDSPLPAWATSGPFISITRTAEELSVVCRQEAVPEGVKCERDWRGLRVAGTLDFSLVGVLSSLLGPLAEAGVSVFVVSTFDTDYLLVKERDLAKAEEVLRRAGQAEQR